MEFPEVSYAASFHRELKQRFESTVPPTTLSISGPICTAERGDSYCTIACFDVEGPRYHISFERQSQRIATARVASQADGVEAIEDWLRGSELSVLYQRYKFIDQPKRAVSRFRAGLLEAAPELRRAVSCEVEQKLENEYCLRFKAENRSCNITVYGNDFPPESRFGWDECELFRCQTDDAARLAAVLKRWLCDHAMPSAMRAEFPWIRIGDLADYYELGRPIEGEFIKSWDGMGRFYKKMRLPLAAEVIQFMAAMRQKGYDRSLRAGQSLGLLILSRSRRHGLLPAQPTITFCFRDKGLEASFRRGSEEEKATYPDIALTPEIESMLKRLKSEPIE